MLKEYQYDDHRHINTFGIAYKFLQQYLRLNSAVSFHQTPTMSKHSINGLDGLLCTSSYFFNITLQTGLNAVLNIIDFVTIVQSSIQQEPVHNFFNFRSDYFLLLTDFPGQANFIRLGVRFQVFYLVFSSDHDDIASYRQFFFLFLMRSLLLEN